MKSFTLRRNFTLNNKTKKCSDGKDKLSGVIQIKRLKKRHLQTLQTTLEIKFIKREKKGKKERGW